MLVGITYFVMTTTFPFFGGREIARFYLQ